MSVKRNIIYNTALSISNVIFPIITVPYTSRILGVVNIGLVNFISSFVGYFSLFAALGVSYYGVREIAKYKDNNQETSKIFSEIFFLTIITTIAVSICYCISIVIIPALQQDWKVCIIAGINLFLTPIAIDWYFRGLEQFKIITYRSIVIRCLSLAGLFIFVRKREDVIPYILILVFSNVGAYIWNLMYAQKIGLKITWIKINVARHIKPMFTFFIVNISISIFTMLDTLMLGFLSSYEQVGFYTSPNRILAIIIAVISAINAVLLPRIAFNKQQNNDTVNKKLLQKTFDVYALLLIPVSVGLCLISSRFVPIFFGREYIDSILPMQILSFKVMVVMINSFFGVNILVAFGHEKRFVIATVLTAIFSFIINWFNIPKYGAVGASITAIMAEIFEMIILLFLVYKMMKISISWYTMLKSLLFTVVFFLWYFLADAIISNNIVFLGVFISSALVVYFFMQLFIAKNYIIIEMINMFRQRINPINKGV